MWKLFDLQATVWSTSAHFDFSNQSKALIPISHNEGGKGNFLKVWYQ